MRMKTFLTKTYAKTLFISFSVILVLVVICGFALYHIAADTIRTEIDGRNEEVISELASNIDSKLESAGDYVSKAAYHETVKSIAFDDYKCEKIKPIQIYNTYLAIQDMHQKLVFQDTFVYFLFNDYIISGIYPSTIRSVYDTTNYSGHSLNEALLTDLLQSAKTTIYFPVENTIAAACVVPTLYYKVRNALAVCVLNAEYLCSNLKGSIADDASFTILTSDGKTLFSYGTLDASIQDQAFIEKKVTSSKTNLTYSYAIGYSSYWSRLNTFKHTIYVAMSVFFFFGIALIIILTKVAYKPVGTLMKETDINDSFAKSGGEFAYLRQLLSAYTDEHNNYYHVLKEQFFDRAVHGLYPADSDIYSEFAHFGISLISDYFTAIMILEEPNEEEWIGSISEHEAILFQAYTSILSQHGIPSSGFVLCVSPNTYTFILNSHPNDYEKIQSTLPEFMNAITSECNVAFTITLSQCRNGWNGLSTSFKNASAILSLRAVKGKASIIAENECTGFAFNYSFLKRNEFKAALLAFIYSGKPGADEVMDSISKDCCPNGFHLTSEFLCYSDDCYHLIVEICNQLGLDDEFYRILSTCESFPEFQDTMISILNEIHSSIEEINIAHTALLSEEVCSKIVRYIEENISNCDLCPDIVGRHFNKSGQYISKQFKLVTGITIAAQINNSRIELAKNLLRTTDDSVQTVATKGGFISASAFNRVFKKATDMTPSTYRKLYREISQ